MTLIERKIPPLHECTSPSPVFKVSESVIGMLWEVNLERTSQLDNDWNVVRAEGREGAPLRIQGYVEVGRWSGGQEKWGSFQTTSSKL